ncbi:MAG: hypothetical protein AB1801_19875, partial [Chloroflexota bacterium]
METPILRTKIYVPQPQPGGLIPRPSLLEKLDKEVLEHRLTLISAPAGSGKTTLVSQWHTERMKAEGGGSERKDEGGRMKDEMKVPANEENERMKSNDSSFILHNSSLPVGAV